ncbi:MAG TPA: glycine--tRNA ligase subunit beta, partial [Pseudoxanthomonas sp.]|nr:glycine--tRNA ligase subunit beta [Pseudoxanthomonas sp.]
AQARRAAELGKADLQSRMVNEFPELQGIAGRHYAIAAGEPKEIALAIDEAYQPRFAGDDIALSPLGKVLAIAERLDTLAGGFAAGLKPTGNKDPFALRRNALGLARTVIESGFDLDIQQLINKAAERLPASVQPHADRNTETLLADLYDFILDRLRGYYADKGVPTSHFNAVAALFGVAAEAAPTGSSPHLGGASAPTTRISSSLYDFDTRIDAIGTFATLPEAEALAAANKRINNILKKSADEIPHSVNRSLLNHPAESALAEAVEAAIGDTDAALHQHDYIRVLSRLALLRPQVDAFFDGVMVNVEDPDVRTNRLALLKRLADRFRTVAAIEHLSA